GVCSPLQDAVLDTGRPAGRGFRAATLLVRWVQHRVEHLEPAFDRLIVTDRYDQEIARPGRCDIGYPDRLRLIATPLLRSSFQELGRRRATKLLHPEMPS